MRDGSMAIAALSALRRHMRLVIRLNCLRRSILKVLREPILVVAMRALPNRNRCRPLNHIHMTTRAVNSPTHDIAMIHHAR